MTAYAASPTKRARATRSDMERRYDALLAITTEMQPMTVRQAYYAAVVRGIVDKTEAGYDQVQRALSDLRRIGRLPYDWIVDLGRFARKPISYDSPFEALRHMAATYRKALWPGTGDRVVVFVEKDALVGVIYGVTSDYDVPLISSRGYASLSCLYDESKEILAEERPTYIYHLGDFDPSGVNAAEKIEETLRDLAPGSEIHFERLAVLPEQIEAWELPTRPTKGSDSRAKGFGPISVELDAVDPNRLRTLLRNALDRRMPSGRLEELKALETAERQHLLALADDWGTDE